MNIGWPRIILVAPSGSGKSTVAKCLHDELVLRGVSCEIIKLASPLYLIQRTLYEEAGLQNGGATQNHRVLETIADLMRDLNPRGIVDNFLSKVARSKADCIINDDLRDYETDWPVLQSRGFKVVKVRARVEDRATRLSLRADDHVFLHSKLDAGLEKIPADAVIENLTDLASLRANVREFLEGIVLRENP